MSPLPQETLDAFWKAVERNAEEASILILYETVAGKDYRVKTVVCADREALITALGESGSRNYGVLDRYDLSKRHAI